MEKDTNTKWKLFDTNDEAWEAMLKDCKNAKESIVLEQFIFTTDGFGDRLIDVCKERAKQGVKIRFLWDAIGSFTFWGTNIIGDLRKDGIELLFWKTLIPGYYKVPNIRSWYFRNHRRTLVIDGKVGYTGSMCVKDAMLNWRDTNVRLEGPVVKEMQNAFDRMWSRAIKERPLPKRARVGDKEFRYITNYPAPGRRHINDEIIKAISKAREYVYITTPYFVPTNRIIRVIKSASQRGVEVILIIPKNSNYYSVDLGARSYFETLLHSGVRIFLYGEKMIHSKTFVIDGNWSSVGTLNLDSASLLYNFEANIVTTNTSFAKELTDHFITDMGQSTEVHYRNWKDRMFFEKLPEILIKLVRRFL